MKTPLAVAVLFTFTGTAASFASLISGDDPLFGPDSITIDTDTGLEWLDVTQSLNLSFNAAASQFAPGWRHATRSEVETLFFQSAGLFDAGGPVTVRPPDLNIETLVQLLGDIPNTGVTAEGLPSPNLQWVANYDDGIRTDEFVGVAVMHINRTFQPHSSLAIVSLGFGGQNAESRDTGGGNLLVRAHVASIPEPTAYITWLLMGLTIGGCWWRHKKA